MDDRAKIIPFPVDRANELRAIEEDHARIIAYRKARSIQKIRETRAWLRKAKAANRDKGRPGRPLGDG